MTKRKSHTLQCAPFPVLSWGSYYWTCPDLIPAWAGYRSLETEADSDGTIVVAVASHDKSRTPPTRLQIAAYKHLRSNAKKIATAISKRIFKSYADLQTQYAGWVASDEMPDIAAPDDLKELIGFAGIHIHRTAKGGVSYIGIQLDCTWDAEHGLGVMMHRNRVVRLGGADTAILEWIAEVDAKR